MRLFRDKFKAIAEKETRVVKVFRKEDQYSLPPDEYAFFEYYCDEEDCDCRRVMISVFARKPAKFLATISFGFDSEEDDAGPYLEPLTTQSEYSQGLLDLFIDVVNSDPDYLARLQRHYVMFKEKIDGEKYAGEPFEAPGTIERKENIPSFLSFSKPGPAASKPAAPGRPKVGRNQPCPCGSGKKYKKCCMNSPAGDKGETMEARTARAPRRAGGQEPRAAAGEMIAKAGIEEAEALVMAVASRMERKTEEEKVDQHTLELIKRNPLIVDPLLELLLDDYAPRGTEREMSPSYQACLVLLELALTELRYSIERNRAWAVDGAERIQREMAARAFEVEVDARVQTDLVRALHSAGLEIHPEIKAKSEKLAEYYGRFMAQQGKPSLDGLFEDLASSGANDPFALMEPIMAELELLPVEGQVMIVAEMARARNPLIRDFAALMLLHPNHELRVHVPSVFAELVDAKSVSPVALRRMIGFRNWLPEAERPALDRLIRRVRAAHVECAPMPRPREATTYASPFDGAGAQAVWNIVGKKRNHRMRSVLLKQGIGIRDIMVLEHMNRKEVESLVEEMRRTAMSEKIELSYMNRAVSHFIWLGRQLGSPPPAGLLQVAEELGGEYWTPRRVAIEEEISALEEAMDSRLRSSTNVSRVLRESRDWPEKKRFATSWFEDDSAVDEALACIPGLSSTRGIGAPQKAVDRILEEVIRAKYDVWAERLLWMTLWAKACISRSPLPWEDFFIVARQFRRSAPLEEIPLLTAVAERSVLSALRRVRSTPS